MVRCDGQYAEEAFGSGSSRREGRTRFFFAKIHSNLKTNISAPSRSTQTPMQCSLWRKKGTSSRWKKRNGKNIFLPQNLQNYCCRWTRWSPPGRWSPSTLRPRGCPTSSMSTGPTPFTDLVWYQFRNILWPVNNKLEQESHPCGGEVLWWESTRSLQPWAGFIFVKVLYLYLNVPIRAEKSKSLIRWKRRKGGKRRKRRIWLCN